MKKRSINLPYRLPDFTPENLLFRYCSLCYTIFYLACRESSLDILFLIVVWMQKNVLRKKNYDDGVHSEILQEMRIQRERKKKECLD